MSRCVHVLVLCIATGLVGHRAVAAVKAASTDGEATVYLAGQFSRNFDVAYEAVLRSAARNKSWSSLSVLLIGSQVPGPGASVGLISDPPHHRTAQAFTYVVYPGRTDDFEDRSSSCSMGCLIELRGDARSIYAYVNGKILASWSRSDLYLQRPEIQLNAEVHAPGDSLDASLTPVRTNANGRHLSRPACASTTRGIEPIELKALAFRGTMNDSDGTFINLVSRARGDHC